MSFNIYALITPIVLIMLGMEIAYNYFSKSNQMPFQDSVTNIGTAIGNQLTNLMVMFTVYFTFGWIHENFAIANIETNWWTFCILLVLFDFLFYWFHRHGHTINILWAAHMPHHSSEEFNLFVGLRASITQRLFSFLYMWPLAILGFTPEAIYAASAVQLLLAYWHHTKFIPKMGWFETIFNSPSYHRVHHGINEKYLDKNFGEIFIIWDKMFGTCAVEDEPVVYGSLNPVESWNPNKIYFQYWWYLFEDAIYTKSWWDKIRLWFMPLGWRPEDRRGVPRKRISSETLIKFKTEMFKNLKPYLAVHLLLGLLMMYFVIDPKSPFLLSERITLGFFLWLMITAWGGLLEGKSWGRSLESIRLIVMAGAFTYFWKQHTQVDLSLAVLLIVLASLAWILFFIKPNFSQSPVVS